MPDDVLYDSEKAADSYAVSKTEETGNQYSVFKVEGGWVVKEAYNPVGEWEAADEAAGISTRATGGMVDELGYMHGGMPHGKRDPIKYAAGGAVRGKRFVGTF